jgi:hypothetical protein
VTDGSVADGWRGACPGANEGRGDGAKACGQERKELPTAQRSGSGTNLINREPLGGRTGWAAG